MKSISTGTPRTAIQALMDKLAAEMAALPQGLEASRRNLDDRGTAAPLAAGVNLTRTEITDTLGGETLTPDTDSGTTMLYLHGGGYCAGSSRSHRPLCSLLAAKTSYRVLVLDYRRAPENPFPAALQDSLTAYDWLLRQGTSADSVVIAGDSAGGGLTMATLLALRDNYGGLELPMPLAAVGLSPWLDTRCSSASYLVNGGIDLLANADSLRLLGAAYSASHSPGNPLLAPFYAKDLGGLCPMLLQVGSAETLLDEVVQFALRAETDGVSVECQVWENMVHVWHSFGTVLPESAEAIEAIGDWLAGLKRKTV